MIRVTVLLAAALFLLAPTTAVAGTSDDLSRMLEQVPGDAMAGGSTVSYVDYRAVEASRPGAARPGSTEEWASLRDGGGPAIGLWLAALRGVSSGSGDLLNAFTAAGAEQPALLGFDFFDVDREIHFGSPPTDGVVLAGAFDPPAIAAAHEARGFTTAEVPGGLLICGPGGCDDGTAVDVTAVERADPFGGRLGRRQPLLATTETLLSSAALGTVLAMQGASEGTLPSLADDARVRLALDAIPGDATLRQATFVPAELLVADVGALMLEAAGTGEDPQEYIEGFALEPMPPYGLVLLADTATPEEQVVNVVLVYGSAEDAQAAAAVLPGRVAAGRSLRADGTVAELLDGAGVTDVSARVHVDAGGAGAAAVLTLRAPLPSPDVTEVPIVASSLPYRLMTDMVVSRDVTWLAPSLPSEPGG